MNKNRIAVDSAALTSIKLLSLGTGIVSTMILSHTLPLVEYGTYSTGNLIINAAAPVSAFGLLDAVNYYYNGKAEKDRTGYVNTIIAVALLCGLVMGAVLFLARGAISEYFHNPALESIYLYLIFRPVLTNLGGCLENLQISIGKAKLVAFRNGIISVLKMAAVIVTSLYTKDIVTIFICMLILEAASVFLYDWVLRRNQVHIRLLQSDFSKVKEILAYCVPMGLYIQINTISRDLDKFVIGFFEQTDRLAIYTNCAAKLPLNMLSCSMMVIVMPLLARCMGEGDCEHAARLFQGTVKIGYLCTMPFGVILMVLARQAVQFLYGDNYLPGLGVFMLYLLVDMLNFASFSLVLSASGKTGALMAVSCFALLANLVLNFGFYAVFGFIGPAIATVLVTLAANLILLKWSGVILNAKIAELFDIPYLGKFFAQLLAAAVCVAVLRRKACELGIHYAVIFLVLGALGAGSILLLNLKEITGAFHNMNRIYEESGSKKAERK